MDEVENKQNRTKPPSAFSIDTETKSDLRWLADQDTDGNMSQMLRRLVRQEKARRLEQAQA